MKGQATYVAIMIIYVVIEHVFFMIKMIVQMLLKSRQIIINGKNKQERQYTRDFYRKNFMSLLDSRRKAYINVQQRLLLEMNKGNAPKYTGGRRVDYMLNHTRIEPVTAKEKEKVKRVSNFYEIAFSVY